MGMKDLLLLAAASKALADSRGALCVASYGVQMVGAQPVVDAARLCGGKLYGSNNRKLPKLSTSVLGVPVFSLLVSTVKDMTPPPEECFRIHLCTPDPDGQPI